MPATIGIYGRFGAGVTAASGLQPLEDGGKLFQLRKLSAAAIDRLPARPM
jgi:hypothetical protein